MLRRGSVLFPAAAKAACSVAGLPALPNLLLSGPADVSKTLAAKRRENFVTKSVEIPKCRVLFCHWVLSRDFGPEIAGSEIGLKRSFLPSVNLPASARDLAGLFAGGRSLIVLDRAQHGVPLLIWHLFQLGNPTLFLPLDVFPLALVPA